MINDAIQDLNLKSLGPGAVATLQRHRDELTDLRKKMEYFRHLAAIWLGLPIRVPDVVLQPSAALPPSAASLKCLKCGKSMDLSGDHTFQCRHITMSSVQNFRHNDICNGVKTLVFDDPLARAGIAPHQARDARERSCPSPVRPRGPSRRTCW